MSKVEAVGEGANATKDERESDLASLEKIEQGLAEIEARPGEYFFYPFDYSLVTELTRLLKEKSECQQAAAELISRKKDLFGKMLERMKQEMKSNYIQQSSRHAEVLDLLKELAGSDGVK